MKAGVSVITSRRRNRLSWAVQDFRPHQLGALLSTVSYWIFKGTHVDLGEKLVSMGELQAFPGEINVSRWRRTPQGSARWRVTSRE